MILQLHVSDLFHHVGIDIGFLEDPHILPRGGQIESFKRGKMNYDSDHT